MTEPADFDERTTPVVTLGGRNWPIPELAPRQYTLLWGDLIELTEALDAAEAGAFGSRVLQLTTAQFAKMQDCVYIGLTRAHPSLTRDEFLDLACSTGDIVRAFLVVRMQTGLFGKRTGDGDRAPGEAQAAERPTGTS
jgi:hypothetical protein